jgi:hypothetical protein
MPTQTTDLFLLEDLEEEEGRASLWHAIKMRLTPSQTGSRCSLSGLTRISGASGPSVPSSGPLERKTLWLAPEQIADRGVPYVVELHERLQEPVPER